jgi:hypothetical protein
VLDNQPIAMRRTHRITLFAFLLLVIIVCLFYLTRSREPHFQGRSLSSWLKQLDDGDTEGGFEWSAWEPKQTPQQKQAAEAIRQIGTNSLPFLIHHMTNRESTLKTNVLDFLRRKQSLIKILPYTNHHPRQAALAFDALGPIARPAAPALSNILTNSELSKEPTIALAAIGPDGWAVLHDRLINTNMATSWMKISAIWGLASHHIHQPGLVDFLINEVTDPKTTSGGLSAWALGELGTDHAKAVPALIQALQSKDLGTRWGACYGLGKFGTNAAIAVPALQQCLEDPDSVVRDYSKNALKLIDPKALKKAGKKKS